MKHDIKKIKRILKKINTIVSIIASWSILFGISIYIIGSLLRANITDNDLIINDIMKQLPKDASISQLTKTDMHGFGIDSLIVTTNEDFSLDWDKSTTNQLLIFEKIESNFLRNIYSPFGIGSTFHVKYKLALKDEHIDRLYFDGVTELTGNEFTGNNNLFKEIVVGFSSIGTSGWNEIAIISYQNNTYKVIGTIPDTADEINNMNMPKEKVDQETSTLSMNYTNLYNKNEKFALNGINGDYCYYFNDIDSDKIDELIICEMVWLPKESHVDPHYYRINIYIPSINENNGRLNWSLVFTKYTNEKVDNINLEYALNFIKNKDNLDGYLHFIPITNN